MSHTPAFSTALLRAKTAYNAQATREGRLLVSEHDLEEAVWAVYELLTGERPGRQGPQPSAPTSGTSPGMDMTEDQQGTSNDSTAEKQ